MKNYGRKFGGLNPLKKDRRDFRLGTIVKLPDLSELPDEFVLEDRPVKNQLNSPSGNDLCSAYGTTLMNEFQEGVELNPEWSFAAGKKISGKPDQWGQDMRTAMKAHKDYGAVEQAEIKEIPQNPRYLASWDKELIDKARKHYKASYVSVVGQYDPFDDIRASIWYFRNEKRAVGLGFLWGWDFREKVLREVLDYGEGHFIVAVGWKKLDGETFIMIQNSAGTEAGENGKHLVSRKVINHFADKYGAMMFIDENPDEIKKLQWTFLDILKDWLMILSNWLSLKKNPTPQPVEIPPAPVVSPVEKGMTKLQTFAKAIQEFEGWYPPDPDAKNVYPLGSLSWRNRNPGNLKYTSLTAELGATGKDQYNLCIFESYEKGFNALCSFIRMAGENKLSRYHDCSILSFFQNYAGENQKKYAKFVADKLKVSTNEKVANLIS